MSLDISTLNYTVRSNNLYRNGSLIVLGDNSGDMLLLRDTIDIIPGTNDEYHTVGEDDRIDLIAYNRYSKYVDDASKFWWVIADANGIQEPLNLDAFVNTDILIPNILNVLLLLE